MGTGTLFWLTFTRERAWGCPQHRHHCTRVPSPHTHRGGTCVCQHTLQCSAATLQDTYCARTKERWKKVGMGDRGLLISTEGKAEKEHNLAGPSLNQSHFYTLFFFWSLLPSLISEYAMVLVEYLSPAPPRDEVTWRQSQQIPEELGRASLPCPPLACSGLSLSGALLLWITNGRCHRLCWGMPLLGQPAVYWWHTGNLFSFRIIPSKSCGILSQ